MTESSCDFLAESYGNFEDQTVAEEQLACTRLSISFALDTCIKQDFIEVVDVERAYGANGHHIDSLEKIISDVMYSGMGYSP